MPSFSGVPAKPNGFVGKGGARERILFSPKAEMKFSGLCDDAGMGYRMTLSVILRASTPEESCASGERFPMKLH